MTSKERLTGILEGRPVDRVPVTMFVTDTDIQDGLCDCVIGDRSNDVIGDLIRFHRELGIDIILRVGIDVFEPIAFDIDMEAWKNSWRTEDGNILVHTIATPGGELCEKFNLAGETFHGDYKADWMKLRNIRTKALVKTSADLDIIKKYRPPVPRYDFSGLATIERRLGDKGVLFPRAPSSVFNSAAGLMNLEDLLTAALTDNGFYRDVMEFCTRDVIDVAVQAAGAAEGVMRVVGNIANSGMVGGAFYQEHVLPYEKRYVDAIAGAGSMVLFHNCGRCFSLLETYGRMLDGHALESFSPPSCGGDTPGLDQARKALGKNVAMVGNFDQVNTLKDGPAERIRGEVEKIFAETAGDGRFIFSTSDSLAPGTPRRNIEIMVEHALKLAG